jgi:hypothetical protein
MIIESQESFAMFEGREEEKETESRCYKRPTKILGWNTRCWCFKKETDCAIFAFLTFGVVSYNLTDFFTDSVPVIFLLSQIL